MENILHTSADVVAILPMGCGKSLLFLLHCHANRHLTNVVIVTTISLQEDLSRQAKDHGISCTTVANSRLLILTPEALAGGATRDALLQLHSSNQLGRIYVDEAHTYSTESSYRPTVRQLNMLRVRVRVRAWLVVLLLLACISQTPVRSIYCNSLRVVGSYINFDTCKLDICTRMPPAAGAGKKYLTKYFRA